jgi:hypothetical protein
MSRPLVPVLSQISKVHTTLSCLSKMHLNIIHLPVYWSSYVHSCFIPFMLHALHISACPQLNCSHDTWQREQVMKLLIMKISATSSHFISPQSKYPAQHPAFKHPLSNTLLGFWTLSIVQNSKYEKTKRFRNWICFCCKVRGGRHPFCWVLQKDLTSIIGQHICHITTAI